MKLRELSVSGRFTLFLPAFLIFVFSSWPAYEFHKPDESQLLVSLKKKTDREKECTAEELKAYEEKQSQQLKHMRKKIRDCGSRERLPLEFLVSVDGQEGVNKILTPAGVHSDGIVFVFERHNVAAGPHDVKITMRDFRPDKETKVWEFAEKVDFQPRKVVLVTFTPESDTLHRHN